MYGCAELQREWAGEWGIKNSPLPVLSTGLGETLSLLRAYRSIKDLKQLEVQGAMEIAT